MDSNHDADRVEQSDSRRDRAGVFERFALFIIGIVGTIWFLLLLLIWTAGWFAWNSLQPGFMRFDPYPQFTQWLLISNVVQLFLVSLILIGQNIRARAAARSAKAEARADDVPAADIKMLRAEIAELKRMVSFALNNVPAVGVHGRISATSHDPSA
jgi:uncharacterized membrane protein